MKIYATVLVIRQPVLPGASIVGRLSPIVPIVDAIVNVHASNILTKHLVNLVFVSRSRWYVGIKLGLEMSQ